MADNGLFQLTGGQRIGDRFGFVFIAVCFMVLLEGDGVITDDQLCLGAFPEWRRNDDAAVGAVNGSGVFGAGADATVDTGQATIWELQIDHGLFVDTALADGAMAWTLVGSAPKTSRARAMT